MTQRWIITAVMLSALATAGMVWMPSGQKGTALERSSAKAEAGVLEIYSQDHQSKLDFSSNYSLFEATAYCVSGTTYSGVAVQRGIVAADPEILPIGSVIEIQAGDYSGIYTVMDTGAVIKGNLIDIYMPEYEEAIQFGRQKVGVRIIRHGWQPDSPLPRNLTVAG